MLSFWKLDDDDDFLKNAMELVVVKKNNKIFTWRYKKFITDDFAFFIWRILKCWNI